MRGDVTVYSPKNVLCTMGMATIPRRTRAGTACPGMLMINSPQKGISVSLRLWLDH